MNETVELWLVRHGETTYSESRLLAGWTDCPLTERGREQAEALHAVLVENRFDSVWSSDLERAVATARLAWGEPQPDARLRELNFGPLEGRSYEDVDWEFGEVFLEFRDFEIQGGDSYDRFRTRVYQFVDGLGSGRHLLFVHGGVIRMLTQDAGLDRFLPTGSLVGLDWTRRALLFVREPENPVPIY